MIETTRRHLYIGGFMGTGKTAVGQNASTLLGRGFIDLDAMVAGIHHRSPSEIFRIEGEESFRQSESRALRLSILAGGSVIALGGGTALAGSNRSKIISTGHCVILTADWPTVWERVRGDIATRPLLAAHSGGSTDALLDLEQFIEHATPLLEARMDAYRLIGEQFIDTSGRSLAEVAGEVADWYGEILRSPTKR